MRKLLSFLVMILIMVGLLADTMILRDFKQQLVGLRSYSFTAKVFLHVRDIEGNYVDTKLVVDVVVNDMTDYRLYFHAPPILEGIEYIYFSKLDKIIIGYGNRKEVYPSAHEYMLGMPDIVGMFTALTDENAFDMESRELGNGEYLFIFYPKTRRVMRIIGMDYSIINLYIKREGQEYKIEEIVVENSLKNEYARIQIENLVTDPVLINAYFQGLNQ